MTNKNSQHIENSSSINMKARYEYNKALKDGKALAVNDVADQIIENTCVVRAIRTLEDNETKGVLPRSNAETLSQRQTYIETTKTAMANLLSAYAVDNKLNSIQIRRFNDTMMERAASKGEKSDVARVEFYKDVKFEEMHGTENFIIESMSSQPVDANIESFEQSYTNYEQTSAAS